MEEGQLLWVKVVHMLAEGFPVRFGYVELWASVPARVYFFQVEVSCPLEGLFFREEGHLAERDMVKEISITGSVIELVGGYRTF